jgi:hypothetical protein
MAASGRDGESCSLVFPATRPRKWGRVLRPPKMRPAGLPSGVAPSSSAAQFRPALSLSCSKYEPALSRGSPTPNVQASLPRGPPLQSIRATRRRASSLERRSSTACRTVNEMQIGICPGQRQRRRRRRRLHREPRLDALTSGRVPSSGDPSGKMSGFRSGLARPSARHRWTLFIADYLRALLAKPPARLSTDGTLGRGGRNNVIRTGSLSCAGR